MSSGSSANEKQIIMKKKQIEYATHVNFIRNRSGTKRRYKLLFFAGRNFDIQYVKISLTLRVIKHTHAGDATQVLQMHASIWQMNVSSWQIYY